MADSEDRGAAPADDAGDDARLLSQDEIDSLLGVVDGAERTARAATTGLDALINTTAVSYERLPMLEVVFDRFVRIVTTSLRNLTSENVEVHL